MKKHGTVEATRELRKAGIACVVTACLFVPAIPGLFLLRSKFASSLTGVAPVPVTEVRNVVQSYHVVSLILCVMLIAITSLTSYIIFKSLKTGDA